MKAFQRNVNIPPHAWDWCRRRAAAEYLRGGAAAYIRVLILRDIASRAQVEALDAEEEIEKIRTWAAGPGAELVQHDREPDPPGKL